MIIVNATTTTLTLHCHQYGLVQQLPTPVTEKICLDSFHNDDICIVVPSIDQSIIVSRLPHPCSLVCFMNWVNSKRVCAIYRRPLLLHIQAHTLNSIYEEFMLASRLLIVFFSPACSNACQISSSDWMWSKGSRFERTVPEKITGSWTLTSFRKTLLHAKPKVYVQTIQSSCDLPSGCCNNISIISVWDQLAEWYFPHSKSLSKISSHW